MIQYERSKRYEYATNGMFEVDCGIFQISRHIRNNTNMLK